MQKENKIRILQEATIKFVDTKLIDLPSFSRPRLYDYKSDVFFTNQLVYEINNRRVILNYTEDDGYYFSGFVEERDQWRDYDIISLGYINNSNMNECIWDIIQISLLENIELSKIENCIDTKREQLSFMKD